MDVDVSINIEYIHIHICVKFPKHSPKTVNFSLASQYQLIFRDVF